MRLKYKGVKKNLMNAHFETFKIEYLKLRQKEHKNLVVFN